MAVIPRGDFGFAVARPQQGPGTVGAAFDGGQADALARGARMLGDVVDARQAEITREEKIAQAEAKAQAKTEARAQAALEVTRLGNDLHDVHARIGRGIADGSIARDAGAKEWAETSAKLTGERMAGIAAEFRPTVQADIERSTGALKGNLDDVIFRRGQQEIRGQITRFGEEAEREAFRSGDPGAAAAKYRKTLEALGPQAGMSAADIETAAAKMSEAVWYNTAERQLEDAALTGRLDVVRSMRERLRGDEFQAIEPRRRNALITRAHAYENGIIAAGTKDAERAKREQEARERDAVDAQRELFDYLSKGAFPAPDYVRQVTDRTTGTAMEKDVREMLRDGGQVVRFASMPLAQQAADLERQRAAMADPKTGSNPTAQKVYEQLQRIHQSATKEFEENPWQAAQLRGVIRDAPALNTGSPAAAAAAIGERMKLIGVVEAWGGRKVSPLQPQEAEAIGKMVRSLPIDQQATALGGFGQQLGDQERVAAFGRQILDKDRVLGLAMMYSGAQTTTGRQVAELVLRGDQAIKDKTVKADSMAAVGWRAKAANAIRGAYASKDIEDTLIDATVLIEAAREQLGGGKFASAVDLATGGIREQKDGSRVPYPYGVKEDDFQKRLKAVTPADLAAQAPDGQVMVGKAAVPLAEFIKRLPDASLSHAGPGLYNIRAGLGVVTDTKGRRIVLDLRYGR